MSRESIPTFDLYAELEVSRSASVATIEAAYRSLAKRVHPDVADRPGAAAAGDGRGVRIGLVDTRADPTSDFKRLNIAREWLTDPDLRRRYDAVTAPRPMRALVVTPPAGARYPATVGGPDVRDAGMPRVPSPKHGLLGSDAERIRWLAVAGLGASSLALVAVLALSAFGGGTTQPSLGGGGAFAGGAGGSSQPGTALPTSSPASSPSLTPATLARLQAGAASTIKRLQTASRTGDLRTARALLGATAPGLTVSGLVRAQFPTVAAADISITSNGPGWVATVGTDTLTSTDGSHWTFVYGERPLAVYGRTSKHQPYFLDPSGRHEIDVRVTSVTVTRSTVLVALAWSFPTSSDARAFNGDGLTVPGLTFGSRTYAVAGAPTATVGRVLSATLTLGVSATPASIGTIDVRVLHDSGAFGSVDTVFKLAIL